MFSANDLDILLSRLTSNTLISAENPNQRSASGLGTGGVDWRGTWLMPILCAVVLRLAAAVMTDFANPQLNEYWVHAHYLIEGRGYQMDHSHLGPAFIAIPSAWMPPGQPLIIAAVWMVFGDGPNYPIVLFLLNVCIGTLAVFVFGKIAQAATGDPLSVRVALWLAAIYPPFVIASATFGIASAALLLNALVVHSALCLSQAVRERHRPVRPAVLLGIFGGLLAMFRAEAPLTIAAVLIALIVAHRDLFSLKAVMIAGLLFLSVLAPWTIRNYVTFDRLVLGSSSGGFNLWRGQNDRTMGGGYDDQGLPVMRDARIERAISDVAVGKRPEDREAVIDSLFRTEATEWMREHPDRSLVLALRKFVMFWTIDWTSTNPWRWYFGSLQLAMLGLGLVGIAHARKTPHAGHRDLLIVIPALCLAATLVTMIFFSLPRYQVLLTGMFFPFCALGAEKLLRRLKPIT